MKADNVTDLNKELLQTKTNNNKNNQIVYATMLKGWRNDKIINMQRRFPRNVRKRKILRKEKNIKEKVLKRAIKIKQKRFRRAIEIKKEFKGANLTKQHNNNTSCISSNSSSSSSDSSSSQKKKALRFSDSSISHDDSDSTKSREHWAGIKDTVGYDDDPPSMLRSWWDKEDPETNRNLDYSDFDYMQKRYGVALPFYLPTNITDRFIDLKEMGLREKCKCPRIYIPVCSYDNRTYVNECILNCIKTKKRRNGPCISYRRQSEVGQVVVPYEWNIRNQNKIQPRKRRSFMRRTLDKIQEKIKSLWNIMTKTKINPSIDNRRDNATKLIRNYLIEHLTAMSYGDKIEEFSNNFVRIANQTKDMKDFTYLFLRATYIAGEKDFFNRFNNIIKFKNNYEYYVKDMLIESLGSKFYDRVNSLFPKDVSVELEMFNNTWKIVPE